MTRTLLEENKRVATGRPLFREQFAGQSMQALSGLITPRVRELLPPVAAASLALVIFLFDALSTLRIAVAVLYGIVVLISATFCSRRGVTWIAIGCAALTLIAYAFDHGGELQSAPLLRGAVSLAALAVTTFLALKNQTATLVLASSEERYRGIFQSTAAAIWEEDYTEVAAALDRARHDGVRDFKAYLEDNPDFVLHCVGLIKTLDVNDAALRLVQARDKQQLIESLPDVFGAESLPMLRALLLAVAERQPHFEDETEIQTLKGEKRFVLTAATFPPGPHAFERVLVSVTDITERTRTERALEEARTELAHISRVTTLGELTASIAHEVNQPLAAIVSNGEACLRWLDRPEPDLQEAHANLEQIIGQGRRAADVVERLRSLSKNSQSDRGAHDVNALIQDAVSLVEREMREKGVALKLELEADLPKVRIDRVQIQQVIINLLVNGLHAMETADVRELLVRSRRTASDVEISVIDNGVGLSKDAESRLFTSFYTTKPQGMGMGLSICRSIVEAHGGRIRAENNETAGATFSVTLPVRDEVRS